MISMPCVLLTVLINEYCYRYQDICAKFENKDIRKNMIFQINTTTRFSSALVFTVYLERPSLYWNGPLNILW